MQEDTILNGDSLIFCFVNVFHLYPGFYYQKFNSTTIIRNVYVSKMNVC